MPVVLFIIILVMLVLVHEFGHFLAAKLFGIKVEEFGVGFPPRLTSIKKGDTRYSLNLLPLGGFVKIYGEGGEGKDSTRSYASRPAWQRAAILLAGVGFNLIFAFFIFWIGFIIGFPTAINEVAPYANVRDQRVQILEVAQNSPAAKADIRRGDVITKVNTAKVADQKEIKTVEDLQNFTLERPDKALILEIHRGKEVLQKELVARANPPQREGPLGISLAQIGLVSFPWYEAFGKALIATYNNARYVLLGIWMLLKSMFGFGVLIGEISGPVGIAAMTGEFYNLGFSYLLSFIALISVNLAMLNVLPIPALDGGRLFFIIIEKLKGSPVQQEFENRANALGFALLLVLIFIVTVKDILQL